MYHLHTVEILDDCWSNVRNTSVEHHFTCPRCNQVWTIGDWEEQSTITCPTCKLTLEVASLDEYN